MLGMRVLPKLLQKKYREEYQSFLVEGKRGVIDALQAQAQVTQLIMTRQFTQQHRDYCQQSEVQEYMQRDKVLYVSETDFARLSETTTPQGIAAVIHFPHVSLDNFSESTLIAVLEDVRDPGNLGTMIRTADWFGVDGIVLLGGADPYQPKVVRSSMGSLFHTLIYTSHDYVADIATLKNQGFCVIVTRPELAGTTVAVDAKQQKVCVVFGNEAHGTSSEVDQLADSAMSIPKYGDAESLNVAVSFGIVLYELKR